MGTKAQITVSDFKKWSKTKKHLYSCSYRPDGQHLNLYARLDGIFELWKGDHILYCGSDIERAVRLYNLENS